MTSCDWSRLGECRREPAACLPVATFGVTMIFEWDDAKNRANIRKHGFDFADAEEIFRGLTCRRPRHAGGLRRTTLDWSWLDSGSHCTCGFYRTRPRGRSHHFAEKGEPW